MTKPVPGWDQEAQDFWDALPPKKQADQLRWFADTVLHGVGNTAAHLYAAARTIEGDSE